MVHEKEVKWSKHAPQTVEIHYNGIGYVGSGQLDVEETMEAPDPLQTKETEEPPAGIVDTMTCRGIPESLVTPVRGNKR